MNSGAGAAAVTEMNMVIRSGMLNAERIPFRVHRA